MCLVDERMRGRAIAVVMNGLMLGTLLGLPLATFVGGRLGWQCAFWTISVVLGSAIGSALTPTYGLRAPVVLGIGMVILATLVILRWRAG